MATSPDLTPDPKFAAGLSRRSVLTRTATGLGITLTGSLGGLFGADAALGADADDDQGEARSRESEHADNSEFAGPNFSHDKRILFANVQSPGFVYAIQGPFRRQR